jgi:glycosyltransferase involved in cell wall biosynthesis
MQQIDAVGVIVPAHNEEQLLPHCVDSVLSACDRVGVRAAVAVVLDRCSDETARVIETPIAQGKSIVGLSTRLPGVGAARAAGAQALLGMFGAEGLWLATTDADSVVPSDWIDRQLSHARRGAQAVIGTVRVADWSAHPASTADRYALRYLHEPGHRHMHGANLSFAASAYLAAGGFGNELQDEDVSLIGRLERSGCSLVWAADLPVTTSARPVGRAPGGFASYLAQLAALSEHAEETEADDAAC